MASEREVRKETDFWGNEKEVIYEDGERVGEIREAQRGGILGIGSDPVKVEYDNSGNEISYTKQEERGSFLGIGGEPTEVRYDSANNEVGQSRVEERGGFLSIGSRHVRVEYDKDGNEISQSNFENRGGLLGIGSELVRVTRYSNQPTNTTSNPENSFSSDSRSPGAYSTEKNTNTPVIRRPREIRNFLIAGFVVHQAVLYEYVYRGFSTYVEKISTASSAFEGVINTVFYFIVGAVIYVLGFVFFIPGYFFDVGDMSQMGNLRSVMATLYFPAYAYILIAFIILTARNE